MKLNSMDSLNSASLRKISDPGGGEDRFQDSSNVNTFLDIPDFSRERSRKFSAPSCQALKTAVSTLFRMDDFHKTKIGSGFFSDVFKVTHKTSHKVMVLKLNKHRSNRNNMLKEVQLMNKLSHPNILKLEAACVHEGQLHALTEFINGGSLEQLIQRKEVELPWSIRMSLAVDMARGLAYLHSKGMFHRDFTSKNVLIQRDVKDRLKAVVGDFGLAAKVPSKANKLENIRLPQVGSPYWMSPECLRGKYYDEKADIFSYGIIMCELIGRVDADPDVLPRTENFGLDYIAFSAMCPKCPPDFLKLTYNCVKVDPATRPTAQEIVEELIPIHQLQLNLENKTAQSPHHRGTGTGSSGKIQLRKVGHKRSLSEEEIVVRKSPSEKARFHYLAYSTRSSVMSIGKEMSMKDPHYKPAIQNPFATLPRLREGKKIIGSSRDLFSSCFELPSPARVATPTSSFFDRPDTPPTKSTSLFDLGPEMPQHSLTPLDVSTPISRFEDHLFHGRVELLKRLYSGGRQVWSTQDDSVLSSFSSGSGTSSAGSTTSSMASSNGLYVLRRRGSCESGFYSSVGGSVDDWLSTMQMSKCSASATRSMGSSLLTVSDLEEDLRAASAFLSSNKDKRTSSIFTDSTDDLSSLAEDFGQSDPTASAFAVLKPPTASTSYEKDIRDIVEYFEASCRVSRPRISSHHHHIRLQKIRQKGSKTAEDMSVTAEVAAAELRLPRSQKIESLIKRVVEKESRERLQRRGPQSSLPYSNQQQTQQRLQICDGIVRSKLQVFDETKRPSRLPKDHKGFVKAKMAIFDGSKTNNGPVSSTTGNAKRLAEKRLLALANAASKSSSNSRISSLQKEFKN